MPEDADSGSMATLQETQFASEDVIRAVVGDDERVRQQRADEEALDSATNGHAVSQANDHGIVEAMKPQQPDPLPHTPSARVVAPDLLRGFIMILQSIDHSAMTAGAWAHGQAVDSEKASTPMTRWNVPVAYGARTATHLCAPGFSFLLGMGIAYFGRSRSKLDWSAMRMVRHFVLRAVALILVNQVLSMLFTFAFIPILNIILLALAFNYLFVGLLWLAISWTEPGLAKLITQGLPGSSKNPEMQHLLHTDSRQIPDHFTTGNLPSQISFHIHNTILLTLFFITMWWNIWLDPQHGNCNNPASNPSDAQGNIIFEFFFQTLINDVFLSVFPPLAWISPALLGLLYGRIITTRKWRPLVINLANLAVGLTFFITFILTRVLHFGNLDENCLDTPDQRAHPGRNQYLLSARSFFFLVKYPPSPSYLFFALGCNFILLSLFGFVPVNLVAYVPLSILIAYGTSALFFYALHLILYEALGAALKQLFGGPMDWNDMSDPSRKAVGVGPGLLYWVMWVVGLAVLWPACRWYGRFKAGKGVDSLWRFF